MGDQIWNDCQPLINIASQVFWVCTGQACTDHLLCILLTRQTSQAAIKGSKLYLWWAFFCCAMYISVASSFCPAFKTFVLVIFFNTFCHILTQFCRGKTKHFDKHLIVQLPFYCFYSVVHNIFEVIIQIFQQQICLILAFKYFIVM